MRENARMTFPCHSAVAKRRVFSGHAQAISCCRFCLLSVWLATRSLAVNPSLPTTAIKAEHYEALKDVLINGDVVYAFVIRDPAGGAPPAAPQSQTVWNEEKYKRRMVALNAIKDSRIKKEIVVSSVEDLKENLSRFPKDLAWAAYNSEPGMTPTEELLDMEQSVVEFAKIAHGAGLKASWGPTNFMIAKDEAKFLALAKHLDEIGLQHQRTLQNEGVDAFVTLTKKRVEMIRKINPQCHVAVQVVIGRGSKDDLIKALRLVVPCVDSIGIWTMQDTTTAMAMLRSLRQVVSAR